MELQSEELANDITQVALIGALDLAGTEEIGLKLNVLAGSRKRLLMDMTGLTFLSSMGIRSLITVAKTVTRRGGKVVLLKPIAAVEKVLVTTGCDSMMPIHHDQGAALAEFAV
ncbi:MAG: STAS domain-containing protein [Acetobacteraceae bacterium]|nr:STAS domain-containing protein [Acetobacteraceae bacterium]